MRINVKNAISFTLVEESDYTTNKIENGFNPETFKVDNGAYRRKTHLILDFGTFERTVWFNTDKERDYFIKSNFSEFEGCVITE